MKVLLYSKPFWPMVGGIETYGRLLAQGLAQEGSCEVTVVTAAQGPSTMPGAGVHIVRRPGVAELWKIIQRSDVVLLAGPVFVPLALSLLARKRVIVGHHGYQACCPNGMLLFQPEQSVCPQRFLRGHVRSCLRCNRKTMGPLRSAACVASTAIRRWLCHYSVANICVSEHLSLRVRLPRSYVIYHGLPPNDNVAPPVSAAGSAEKTVFAYVGRIVSEKGLPLLLEAASILKREGREFEVRIAGDGPDRAKLERLAQELDLSDRLIVTGFLDTKALRLSLEDVEAVVMPSVWEETAGLAAMEQMMRGRIVIASDIGGLSELLGTSGLKFQPKDVAGLASRLRQVLDNTSFLTRVAIQAGDKAAQKYQQEQMVKNHLQVLQKAANVVS